MDQYCSLQKEFAYFVKRTPDTLLQVWNDGMAWYWYEVTWYWNDWDMVWGFHTMVPWN